MTFEVRFQIQNIDGLPELVSKVFAAG